MHDRNAAYLHSLHEYRLNILTKHFTSILRIEAHCCLVHRTAYEELVRLIVCRWCPGTSRTGYTACWVRPNGLWMRASMQLEWQGRPEDELTRPTGGPLSTRIPISESPGLFCADRWRAVPVPPHEHGKDTRLPEALRHNGQEEYPIPQQVSRTEL